MALQHFTQEQMEQLRANPYTYSVSPGQIYFTKEFKEQFYRLRQNGMLPRKIVKELGYDPEILGSQRISGISHLINKARRNGTPFTEGRTVDTGILDQEDPPITAENFRKLQHEVQYLRNQIDFIKKISILSTTEKRG